MARHGPRKCTYVTTSGALCHTLLVPGAENGTYLCPAHVSFTKDTTRPFTERLRRGERPIDAVRRK